MSIMNPILNETDLFTAIEQNNPYLVKQYVDLGGRLDIRSPKGLTPLAATAMLLHKEKVAQLHADNWVEKEDDLAAQCPPQPAPVAVDVDQSSLSKEGQSSLEIGVILLSAGCSLDDRMGKTNRTVKVGAFMKTHFPEVSRSWEAVWCAQKIRNEIVETVDIDARPGAPARKI